MKFEQDNSRGWMRTARRLVSVLALWVLPLVAAASETSPSSPASTSSGSAEVTPVKKAWQTDIGAQIETRSHYQGEEADKLWETIPIPPSPPLSPEEALKTFRLPEGFRIELVAAEPLVEDPVQIAFDPDGRIWAVELRGWMPNANGEGEDAPVGRIVVLEDIDRDGRMDKSTVFLDQLVMARTVAFVEGGVLVAEPPNLLYCRDTDGDLVCDSQVVVDNEYAEEGNPEHGENGLLLAMDNWMYSSKSQTRHRFVDGRIVKETTSFRGQWGISQDDFGRLYYNYNASQLHADLVSPHSLSRNPNFASGLGRGTQSGIPGQNVRLPADQTTWPIRVTPAVTLGKYDLRDDGTLKQFTCACAPWVYRGDQFPKEFYGNVFVCESVGNLVRRNLIEGDGLRLRARNAYENREFLASTDERFRPVNLTTGPDGALYVVDMYRGIIEHITYITTYLRNQILTRGLDKPLGLGRIYRVVYEGGSLPREAPSLSKATVAELAQALASPNGWRRDTAHRLLVERRDRAAVALLKQIREPATARVHALWILDGLDALDWETARAALSQSDPMVRATAVRLSERFIETHRAEVFAALTALAGEEHPLPQAHLLLALGEFRDAGAEAVMASILRRLGGGDDLMRAAAVSGLHGRELEFLESILDQPMGHALPGDLAMCLINEGHPDRVARLCALAETRPALVDGILRSQRALAAKPSVVRLKEKPALLAAVPAPRSEKLLRILTWPGDTTDRAAGIREVSPLTSDQSRLFAAGQTAYNTVCMPCHQSHGQGLPMVAPPLIDNEWVNGPAEKLIRIALHGLQGPIEVNGQAWNSIMVGLGFNPMLDDQTTAGILTYIRRAWGNTADPVSPDLVGQVRAATAGRVAPWTVTELSEAAAGSGTASVDAGKFRPTKPRVIPSGPDGVLVLPAEAATISGPTIKLERKHQNLSYWQSPGDSAWWTVLVPVDGAYRIELEFAMIEKWAGNRFQMVAPASRAEGEIPATGSWDLYETRAFGEIELSKGQQQIALLPLGDLTGALMDLKSIRLVRKGA